MRAVVLRQGRLEVRETPDPEPGPGELLLRTLSTAISASDVHFMDHPEMAIDDPTGRSLYDVDRDIVMGHEFVGEVVGHGPGCGDQFPIGTRVTSMPVRFAGANGEVDFNAVRIIGQHPEAQGSFGELVVVPEMMARAAPGDASNDAIAVVDAFAVGEFYVRSTNIQPGEVAIVVGAGASRALRGRCPRQSRGRTDRRHGLQAERRELARRFGAHVVVDPAERTVHEVWEQALVDYGLLSAPVIFECVGAAGLVQQLVDGASMGARIYVAGGWYSGDTLDITTATRQGVTIQFGGGPQPEDWYGTLDAVVEGRLDPTPSIGEVIGLDGVPDALERARRSEGPPRIVVRPNG